MYINSVEIKNIRSIANFSMDFKKPAGWHVLIGDNGSGKSSVVRAIALALIGPTDAQALRLPLLDWIKRDAREPAEISLTINRDQIYDGYSGQKRPLVRPFDAGVNIITDDLNKLKIGKLEHIRNAEDVNPFDYIWSGRDGWFSAAFGPFRRFTGGEKEWLKVYYSNPKAAAHLSVFGEDVALTECLDWLQQLKFKSIEHNVEAAITLDALKRFINEGGLLPHNVMLTDITSDGVLFKDGNGANIDVTLMSDGFRSLLSLIFELIRQLLNTYGLKYVFNLINNEIIIPVPGVVLIDEVDAHLHPTWQTRIGQWFTKYFPNIQFIVTTHSPLVCRACSNGSIWRLAAPGSSIPSGQITGIDRDRLINGNVLDAYGTEIFGQNVSIAAEASEKTDRLAELNIKSLIGEISDTETTELQNLKAIFPTQAL